MSQTDYATEASFKVYIDYLALKLHFTSDKYDYHRSNGKTRASYDSYRTRKDVFYFYKLSKRKDYHEVMLANLLKNPNLWIGIF